MSTLLNNLVSYYKLDDVTDSAGANTLTNNNTVTFASGKIGNAADFGTANTNKSLSVTSDLGITGGNCTISGWLKMRTEIASSLQLLWIQSSTTNNIAYYIGYDYNGGTRRLLFTRSRLGVAGDTLSYTITLGTSDYYHIALTYDGSDVTGYVNGASVGTQSSTGNGTTGGSNIFVVGMDRDLVSLPLSAYIDEVGIWSRALTTTEITNLYNNGSGLQYPFSSQGAFLAFL
jgi:hypothetical protein